MQFCLDVDDEQLAVKEDKIPAAQLKSVTMDPKFRKLYNHRQIKSQILLPALYNVK
jgi:hypothetical protein